MMRLTCVKTLLSGCALFLGCSSIAFGTLESTIVYSNDFNSGQASISDFTIDHHAQVVSGALRISEPYGRASIHTSHFQNAYSSTLKDNPGLVTWSFNVSNQDGTASQTNRNNSFYFVLAANAADGKHWTSTAYIFQGGNYVGNRMVLHRHSGTGIETTIIDIPDSEGLPPLRKGTYRITYDPATGRWSVYGSYGASYTDPTQMNRLLGSAIDDTYTSLDLPYMALGGKNKGFASFDNVTVEVVPEPATVFLVGLGGLAFRRRRATNNIARPSALSD